MFNTIKEAHEWAQGFGLSYAYSIKPGRQGFVVLWEGGSPPNP